MAWNEPGKDDKDPWGNNRGNDGPPDLDDVMRNLKNKLSAMFGGSGTSSSDDQSSGQGGAIGIGLIAAVVFVVWLASGIYIVEPAEQGVVLRFGAYSDTTTSGPHWHLPYPIESVEVVDVEQIRNVEIGYRTTGGRTGSTILSESLMLTQDENIVDLKIAVQYRIKDAADYLFNVRSPDLTLRQMTESAVRETVGTSKMDFVLTEGRSAIAAGTEELLQSMLDSHETGLMITSVNMQDVQPPEQVQAAFADVVKAREDEVRQKNEAEAYANDIVPKARGAAFRLVQEAEAYKSQITAKADGETSRFLQVMKEYEKAPAITKERLYLDTMESVYSRTQKVLVDVSKDSNNVLYLPLDKMRDGSSGSSARINPDSLLNNDSATGTSSSNSASLRDGARNRGGR
jgi:membrane protease subunit HflK